MRSNLKLKDFLYEVPEIIQEWLGDRTFQEDFSEKNENWFYSTKEKNGVISFLVSKGNTKAENSVFITSGPDTINVTNNLSDTQKERVERLLRLTVGAEYDDYCVAKIKYMIKHHKFERLDNNGRFSTLIDLTNAFIEVKNMLDKMNEEERILELFEYDPLNRLEELEKEIDNKSFVPNFKSEI